MSPEPPTPAARRTDWLHLAVVVAVCGGVYWPMLGSSGFSSTEGHRVIPGWEMLESGDWLRTTMFDLGYLRKPPGMPWAVAASSAVLGTTEFAARAVSAAAVTLSAVLSFVAATRWFGRPWGLVAGLGCALMPQFWSVGRAAEIEALNNLATLGGAVLLTEILVPRGPRGRSAGAALAVGAGAAMVLAGVAKGPASLPVFAALPAAACIVLRSARPLLRAPLWGAAALGAAGLLALGAMVLGANGDPGTVRQGVSDFLWTPGHLFEILTLIPAALGAALPVSLALLLRLGTGEADRGATIARTLALGWVLALLVYTLCGISNSRYAMPAAVLLPLVAAQAVRVCLRGPAGDRRRQRIARAVLARGRSAIVAAGLLVGAAVFVPLSEAQRGRASGRDAGRALAAAIAAEGGAGGSSPVVVWADQMIETRPEVLLYAARAAAAEGWTLRPVWAKHEMLGGELPPAGGYALLKTDAGAWGEPARFRAAVEEGRLVRIAAGEVHKFAFVLYRRAEP